MHRHLKSYEKCSTKKNFFLILPKLPQMKTINNRVSTDKQEETSFLVEWNVCKGGCMLFDEMIGKARDQKGWDPLTRVDPNAYATNYF